MRKCISSEEAEIATRQHAKPCSDCPWARAALNGWLGGQSIDDWLAEARGDGPIDCHSLEGASCAGAAIFRANTGKLPRDPRVFRLPANHVLVFSTAAEFREHHSKPPERS
jgi:hypothetical protein